MITPWALHEPDVPEVIHHNPATQAKLAQSKPAQVRRHFTQQEVLETHGSARIADNASTSSCTVTTRAP